MAEKESAREDGIDWVSICTPNFLHYAIAKEFNLLESGGSDFHGNAKPHIRLGNGMGNLQINYSYLEKLRNMTNNS